MRLGRFSHMAVATLGVAALAVGCASSGGGDQKAAATSNKEWSDNSGEAPPPSNKEKRGLLETVYFDYDSSAIRSDMRSVLQADVTKIGQNSSWKTILIEGHCDERGSEEYNLALGERRAAEVKKYLISSGVSGSKLDTVSFGESKPAVQGHDESAWKWNRRAEFVVTE